MGDKAKTSGPEFRKEPIDSIAKPFQEFIHMETAGGAVLLVAAVIALVIANSDWALGFESYWTTAGGIRFGDVTWEYPLRHWINDGLMTLFFFVVGLEIKLIVAIREETWGTKYTIRAYPVDPHQQFRFVSDLSVRGREALSHIGARALLPQAPATGLYSDSNTTPT